jgi:hypothetical protein
MTRLVAALLLAATLVACGGDSTGPENTLPTPNNGSMTMRVDGASWTAASISPLVTAGTPPIISIGASGIIAATGAQAALGFAWADTGVGTYTIGQALGFNATLSISVASFTASGPLGSGTLTVTTRTADRVAGTFAFSLVPSTGSSGTGTRSVTNGAFDIRF